MEELGVLPRACTNDDWIGSAACGSAARSRVDAGSVYLWWWYHLLCRVWWSHCHLARLVPSLLKSPAKSNSKWGFFCSGSLSHLLQGIAVIVDWGILLSVWNKVFAKGISEESRVKHPDDLKVLDTHSFVSWGLWRMSCVVLRILKNQALAELFTIPCLLAIPRREQSPCCLWSGRIIGQIPYRLLLSEKGRADMPWSACWALWNSTKRDCSFSSVFVSSEREV